MLLRPGARAATHISARREPIPSQGPHRAPATAARDTQVRWCLWAGGQRRTRGVLALLPQARCPRPRGQQPRHRGGLPSPLFSGAGDHMDRTPVRASGSAPEQAPRTAADPLGAQKPGIPQAAAWAHLSWHRGGTFLAASRLGEASRAAVCAGGLTGAGVVHLPVVHQHFVKEDDARIAGERLPGEPRREGHQRRRRDPWAERGCAFSQAPGRGPRAVPRGCLSLAFRLKVGTPPPHTLGPTAPLSEGQAVGGSAHAWIALAAA